MKLFTKILSLAERSLKMAEQLGAEYSDVRGESGVSSSVSLVNGLVKSVSHGSYGGLGIRVVSEGRMGFSSTNILKSRDVERIVRFAVKISRTLKTEERYELEDVPIVRDEEDALRGYSPIDIDIDEKVSFLKELYEYARSIDPRVVNLSFTLNDSARFLVIMSSEGRRIVRREWRVFLSMMAVAREGVMVSSMRERYGVVGGYWLFNLDVLRDKIRQVVRNAVEQLGARAPPPGRHMVVIDEGLAGIFAHEAFGHASEGDEVASANSVLMGRLGDRVGVEEVSIADDPTLEWEWGSFRYDDEGTPALRKLLVDHGVMNTYITDRRSAKKLGLSPNGGARAQSYAHPPIVRMSNTLILPGDYSREEVFQEVKRGVFLAGSRGGEVDPSKGTFTFNAERAYLIERGEVSKPLRDALISGSILEVLSGIVAIGKEVKVTPGFCGKGGQRVPVGTGGPLIAVKNLLVGGRK